eukprot:TRINITY_DN8251_c0_g1_i1.p1 TRINITY_DN8251_c0_g1~~TRINITY_DN8251_c0_g1_i1.p1  ORF type:complete len:265 (+),score=60.53 TRINITY_DN8251_c0_g1_i1:55-849(+)
MKAAIIALSAAAASAVQVPGGYDIAPGCIFEAGNKVIDVSKIEKCASKPKDKEPLVQHYAMNVNVGGASEVMTQMNTSYTVPQIPEKYDGQVIYFWPGFKNSRPVMGEPVLQPVLQFGQQGQKTWEFQSWFVDGDRGIAVTGKAIDVKPGDFLTSFMHYDESSKVWTVYSKDTATGLASDLRITREKTTNVDFNYAMLVMETIIYRNPPCAYYPKDSNVTFSNVIVNNKPVTGWTPVYTDHACSENITVLSDNTVRFGFSYIPN